jgi:hypothetical protein
VPCVEIFLRVKNSWKTVSEAKAVERKIGATATILAKTLSAKTSISGQWHGVLAPQRGRPRRHRLGAAAATVTWMASF